MNQQQLVIEKLDKIRKLEIDKKIEQKIYNIIYDEEFNDMIIRTKTDESAIKKLKIRKYQKAEELRDLIGVMITTNTEDETYKIAKKIILENSNCKIEDYIRYPKNGYKSVHLNYSLKTKEMDDIPVEIQIKTENMRIAQELVHDRIYKNLELPINVRNFLSTIMFKYIEYKQNLNENILEDNKYIYKLTEYIK